MPMTMAIKTCIYKFRKYFKLCCFLNCDTALI